MAKHRSIGGDSVEDSVEGSSQFLDALRTHAMDDLHAAALEYGIILKDLAVIDRQFKGTSIPLVGKTCTDSVSTGEIASTMDKLTKRALQAQVEAAVRPLVFVSDELPKLKRILNRTSTVRTATRSNRRKASSRSPA